MGVLGKLFKTKVLQHKQPEGFYVIRYKFGETTANELFRLAEKGSVDAQLTIAKCFKDAAELIYALYWYEKAATAGSSEAYRELIPMYEGRYEDIEEDQIKAKKARKRLLSR